MLRRSPSVPYEHLQTRHYMASTLQPQPMPNGRMSSHEDDGSYPVHPSSVSRQFFPDMLRCDSRTTTAIQQSICTHYIGGILHILPIPSPSSSSFHQSGPLSCAGRHYSLPLPLAPYPNSNPLKVHLEQTIIFSLKDSSRYDEEGIVLNPRRGLKEFDFCQFLLLYLIDSEPQDRRSWMIMCIAWGRNSNMTFECSSMSRSSRRRY